ncbi:MAG TPA: glycoside hydrolase family 3 N-terminal domain-containing protein [Desulfomonilaceae bacterium]|nr:glycoside hydrolase family 3 N-terminal domain-containing protein [Desulfomonilaceae bacterium]
MRFLLAILMLMPALALVPIAWDWRSPFLVGIRPWMFLGLIVLSLSLILGQIRLLRTSRSEESVLRVLSVLGLLIAGLVLASTLALEARFHWVRYQVLHVSPDRLERLGRHFIVGYRDLAEVQELVRLRAIAGVFLSTHNVRGKSVARVRQEIRSLQNLRQEQGLSRLWVATDQEGGAVSRLSPPLSRQPSLPQIVDRYSGDMVQLESEVRKFADKQGKELADLGVNLNFAPVVDVNHQVMNPNDRFSHIYERAISSDPVVVTQVAAWYCASLEYAGVRCTLKHFPGLGRVFEDTHREDANLTASITELTGSDWLPFRVLMRKSRAFTMLGHVKLTAIDKERPLSASASVIAGLLRGEWQYDGVLITDNFSMRAIYNSSVGIDKASITALNAGVDLILISWDPDQYYRVMYALLKADEQGKLDRKTLDQSDRRLERAIRP